MSNRTIIHVDDGDTIVHTSGATSPEDGNTIFSGHGRTPSLDTVASDMTQFTTTVSSDGQNNPPAPPVNSPENRSLAGDAAFGSLREGLDGDSLTERLHAMPGLLTPPGSVQNSDHGKTRMRDMTREGIPLYQLLFKTSTPQPKCDRRPVDIANLSLHPKVQGRLDRIQRAASAADSSAKRDPTFEHTTWAELAEEDLANALARIVMLAEDEQKKDPHSRPLSYYYSIHVAKLLSAAGIAFDTTYLSSGLDG